MERNVILTHRYALRRFDAILILTQALAPAVLVAMVCLKGRSIKSIISNIKLRRGGSSNDEVVEEGGDVELNQLANAKHHHKRSKRVTVVGGSDKYHNDEFSLDDQRRRSSAVRIDSSGMLAVGKGVSGEVRVEGEVERETGKVVGGGKKVVKGNSKGLLELKPKGGVVEGSARECWRGGI